MYKGKKIIGIIPARSGSKGLPDKNIKNLNGKPLVAYTIEAALKSKVFDDVIVSTDSGKYADIARKHGANVPFLRSKETSGDEASNWSVALEVLKNLEESFDLAVILQPTSPLRTSQNIIEALDLVCEKDANAVVSVCKFSHSIKWVNELPDDLSMDGFISKEAVNKRRQELKNYYRLNGALYIIKTDLIGLDVNLYTKGTYAYIMDEKESIDIDSELDFLFAKSLISENYAV